MQGSFLNTEICKYGYSRATGYTQKNKQTDIISGKQFMIH